MVISVGSGKAVWEFFRLYINFMLKNLDLKALLSNLHSNQQTKFSEICRHSPLFLCVAFDQ